MNIRMRQAMASFFTITNIIALEETIFSYWFVAPSNLVYKWMRPPNYYYINIKMKWDSERSNYKFTVYLNFFFNRSITFLIAPSIVVFIIAVYIPGGGTWGGLLNLPSEWATTQSRCSSDSCGMFRKDAKFVISSLKFVFSMWKFTM